MTNDTHPFLKGPFVFLSVPSPSLRNQLYFKNNTTIKEQHKATSFDSTIKALFPHASPKTLKFFFLQAHKKWAASRDHT